MNGKNGTINTWLLSIIGGLIIAISTMSYKAISDDINNLQQELYHRNERVARIEEQLNVLSRRISELERAIRSNQL